MVTSEIRTFSNEKEFLEIVATVTMNDYFTIGEEGYLHDVCRCSCCELSDNMFEDCLNGKIYDVERLCDIAMQSNEICITRNYHAN